MEHIWIDTVNFMNLGGWQPETQFVREMGQPYLIANDVPGTPVEDAVTKFTTTEEGYYRFFVRTKNWRMPEAPGRFSLQVDGTDMTHVCGTLPTPGWYWEIAGDLYLTPGIHTLHLCDHTGWLSRCAAILITNDLDFTPSPEKERLLKQRAEILNLTTAPLDMGMWDFIVVGAGPGGIPAAISAARNGLKTALICGRPHIGGNASEEGTIGFDGAGAKNPGNHETGIANEIKRTKEHFGITWQAALEKLVADEPLITVFTDMLCVDADTNEHRIKSIHCVHTLTLQKYIFNGSYFADCSGDGWLGYYAGACYRLGREAFHEYEEVFAPKQPDTLTMSGCLCKSTPDWYMRGFFMERGEDDSSFLPPDWAVSLPEQTESGRTQKKDHTAEWWLENSNDHDDLWEAEFARDELVRLGVGYFHWLKNVCPEKDRFRTHRLTRLALHNSKRENRRLIGDYVLSQKDIEQKKQFEDTVAYHGWGIDVHHPLGMYSGAEGPFHLNMVIPVLPIPYRCLYSKNIRNLFVASRCSSFSHLALGSTRVENTIATLGQVVGTAAALCKEKGILPRHIYENYIKELQQRLLKDDQTIWGLSNQDANDLAKTASVSASSEALSKNGKASNITDGHLRSTENSCHAWISDNTGLPQSITLTWSKPVAASKVQITTETDLTYPLYSVWEIPPFGLTAKDVTVELLSGSEVLRTLCIKDNYRRQMRLTFENSCFDSLRITITATSGEPIAVLNEVRVY